MVVQATRLSAAGSRDVAALAGARRSGALLRAATAASVTIHAVFEATRVSATDHAFAARSSRYSNHKAIGLTAPAGSKARTCAAIAGPDSSGAPASTPATVNVANSLAVTGSSFFQNVGTSRR